MSSEAVEASKAPAQVIHNPARYAALTTVRFFAASYVAFYHTFPAIPHDHAGTALERVFYLGFTGVGFFFVLSGFILATVYPHLAGAVARRRFWVARLARVYPMYIFSVLLDAPRLLLHRIAKFGIVAGSAGTVFTLASHTTMVQAWWPSLGGLNFPTWSLSTEAFFYFVFPFLIAPVSRIRPGVPLIAALVATWALSFVIPALVAPTDPAPSSFLSHLIGRNPLLRVPDFVAGLLLAQLHRSLAARTEGVALRFWRAFSSSPASCSLHVRWR